MQPLKLLFQGTGLYNKLLPLLLGKKQARTELLFLTTTCKLNNMEKQHYKKRKWKWSHSVPSNSLRPHGLQPTRLLCPGDFPGKGTGVCCHFLLQGIFPTQGSNPGFPHCRQMLYHLSHQGRKEGGIIKWERGKIYTSEKLLHRTGLKKNWFAWR